MTEAETLPSEIRVGVICADWCGTCRAFREVVEAMQQTDAALRWIWVDIDQEEALLESFEIEAFPTLLVMRGESLHYFGAVRPTSETVAPLVRSVREHRLPALEASAQLTALMDHIRHRQMDPLPLP